MVVDEIRLIIKLTIQSFKQISSSFEDRKYFNVALITNISNQLFDVEAEMQSDLEGGTQRDTDSVAAFEEYTKVCQQAALLPSQQGHSRLLNQFLL